MIRFYYASSHVIIDGNWWWDDEDAELVFIDSNSTRIVHLLKSKKVGKFCKLQLDNFIDHHVILKVSDHKTQNQNIIIKYIYRK